MEIGLGRSHYYRAAGRLFPAERLAYMQMNCASEERWDVLSAGAGFTIEMYEMYMAAFACLISCLVLAVISSMIPSFRPL